jgi:WD40 repeat protein/serine/threonine protein kinase
MRDTNVIASPESRLGEIADDFLARLDRGERPSVESYALENSELAQVIRGVFPALAAMRECSPDSPDEPITAPAPDMTHALGDYRILRELGRGGMGVVYEAEQISLGRRVALKVLPFAAALDPKQLQRFRNEAQAAAHLHHTNIVPVHGVGCERGVHYYAMQLIEGQTLAEMISELRRQEARVRGQESGVNGQPSTAATTKAVLSTEHSTRQPAYFRTVASLGVQAAEALEHAHGAGVVHRDIKPGNVLIDGKGKLWITDFGLALLQNDAGLTMTGDLVGTTRYMSPEQALAQRVIVDHRTDIYSLGVTLYELLTLHPVFDGRDRQEVLRQIAFEEPRPPRRLNKTVPVELENIVLKAIEKNPADRYATAQDLADDLERFLKDEPIRAKRPSYLQWARKWARRHKPVVASVGISVPMILCVAVLALAVSNVKINEKQKQTRDALGRVQQANEDLTRSLEREALETYLQRIALAERELAAHNIGHSEELLDACPLRLRGWEWRFLKRQRYGNVAPLQHPDTAHRVVYCPDGRIASGCLDGQVRIWDAASGEVVEALTRPSPGPPIIRNLTCSADGRRLAAAYHDGEICVWSTATGNLLAALRGHHPIIWQVAFSPDGETLASAGQDGTVRLWDLGGRPDQTDRQIRDFAQHTAGVKGVVFTPDGGRLLAAYRDGTVKTWEVSSGREISAFQRQLQYVENVCFSRDARRLAWSCMDGVIKVCDLATEQEVFEAQSNTGFGRSVAFSPDGDQIAVGGFDGTVRLLDGSTGREMLTIYAHPSLVSGVAFSRDGHQIASASYDHTLRIWDAAPLTDDPAPHCITLKGHEQQVYGVAYSPDGRWLASASLDGTVKVWELSSRHAEHTTHSPAHHSPTPRYTLRGHNRDVIAVAFSPDSKTLASGSWDGAVKLWDLEAPSGDTLAERSEIRLAERVSSLGFSPDGKLLAIGRPGGIGLYDPSTCKEVHPFKRTLTPVPAVVFSPDSQRLFSAGATDPSVKIWEVAGDKPDEIKHNANPNATVAVSPDGRFLASPGREQDAAGAPTVKIWDVATRTERRTLKGHQGYVWKVTFSPDGRYLASGSWDSTVKVWDLEAPESAEPVTLRGHAGFIRSLAFSPDGRRLASASGYAGNGEIKIWDAALWDPTASKKP